MRALGIETATSIASVGVVEGDRVCAARALPMRGSHARTVLPLIDRVLADAGMALRDLDVLAVSIGPGSFTGLRIGLSIAKGLALAAQLPIVGVPTLEAYVRHAGPRPGTVCPVLDARKGEVYAAAYRWRGDEPECLVATRATAPAGWAELLQVPCTLVGDGVDAYADCWRGALGAGAELIQLAELPPSGATVARLGLARLRAGGADDLASLEPSYCRASQAEEQRGPLRTQPKLTGGRR